MENSIGGQKGHYISVRLLFATDIGEAPVVIVALADGARIEHIVGECGGRTGHCSFALPRHNALCSASGQRVVV